MTDHNPLFKTLEDQDRYYAAYDKTMALWDVPVESMDIETIYGKTHVHCCGPEDAAPLLLIPGASISSTMWYPNIEPLSRHHRVYTPDIPGDMGKSWPGRPFKQPDDFTGWLEALLDGLGLEKVSLAGLSYGGFIALQFSLARPERVNRLILMSPAGLISFSPGLVVRILLALMPFVSFAARQKLIVGSGSERMVPAIRQLLTKARTNYHLYLPKKFKDHQLRALAVPALLLMGDQDAVYNHRRAFNRARRLLPGIRNTLVPGGGHALNFDQPDQVNQLILKFLQAEALHP